MIETVLQLDGVTIGFGERTILCDLDLILRGRGCVVLLGPSGTGKSTLLRTLAGFNDANPSLVFKGRAQYCGRPLAALNRPPLVMQRTRLLISTAFENLVSDWTLRSTMKASEQSSWIAGWLSEVGEADLIELLWTPVVQLALGQQRRLAILSQVVLEPALLMVDEPTQGLDPASADQVLRLLAHIGKSRAVVVTTHNLMEARRLADEIVLLAARKLREHRPAQSFFESPDTEFGRQLLQTGSCPDLEPEQDTAVEGRSLSAAPTVAVSECASESAFDPLNPSWHGPDQARAARVPASTFGINATAAPRANELKSTGLRACADPMPASRGPNGFTWLLPGVLAGTPWPGLLYGADYDLALLRDVGISRLVSLTEIPFDAELARQYGLTSHWTPIEDMTPPTLDQAERLCRDLDLWIEQGERIAVHCKAGLGRTGTVLGAYRIWIGNGQISAVQALQQIRRLEPGWVQSASQIDFLAEFSAHIGRQGTQEQQGIGHSSHQMPIAE